MTSDSDPSPLRELQLLCHCLNPQLDAGRAGQLMEDYARFTDDDWARLFRRADAARLLPAWAVALDRRGLLDTVPDDLRDAMDAIVLLNRDHNARLVRQTAELAAILHDAGCPAVFIKGISIILGRHYGDFGARMSQDIDVLVPSDRIADAIAALTDAGYAFAEDWSPESLEIDLQTNHQVPPLFHDQAWSMVDLHHTYVAYPVAPVTPTVLIRDAVRSTLDPEICLPAPLHRAAIAVSHSMLRYVDAYGQRVELRDMLDLLSLARDRDAGEVSGPMSDDIDFGNALRAAFDGIGEGDKLDAFITVAEILFGFEAAQAGLPVPRSRGARLGRRHLRGMLGQEYARWYYTLKPVVWTMRFIRYPRYRGHWRRFLTDSAYRQTVLGRRKS